MQGLSSISFMNMNDEYLSCLDHMPFFPILSLFLVVTSHLHKWTPFPKLPAILDQNYRYTTQYQSDKS
jgi:hypothetical protein